MLPEAMLPEVAITEVIDELNNKKDVNSMRNVSVFTDRSNGSKFYKVIFGRAPGFTRTLTAQFPHPGGLTATPVKAQLGKVMACWWTSS